MRVRVVAGQDTILAIADLATKRRDRRVGLLGRAALPAGAGLVLEPCGMVHTWFMAFDIDIIFLDRDKRVVKLVHTLRPFRFAFGGWRARTTIELPAGTLRRAGLAVGRQIFFEPA